MTRMFYLAAIFALLIPAAARADESSSATALVDKVLTAHGGEAALGKAVAFEATLKGFSYADDKKLPVKTDVTCQGYDKMMSVDVNPETKAEVIEVLNGSDGWIKDGDKDTESLSAAQRKAWTENCYMNWITTVFPFKEKGYKLSLLDDIEVNGHKAVGLLVKHEKHDPVKFYFDKETHLLVKTEHETSVGDTGVQVTEISVYSDYKTVQGIKQPFKMTTYWDGKKISDIEVADLKVHDKPVDERLFSKP